MDELLDRCALARRLVFEETEEAGQTLLVLARDPDALVRTEAYDSLGSFPGPEVEAVLREAMEGEPDELARYYAILSWADVAACGREAALGILETLSRSEESPHCQLGIADARLTFGDGQALEAVFPFLRHEDYHIRCCALETLRDHLDDGNRARILQELKKLPPEEPAVCVRDRVGELLSAT